MRGRTVASLDGGIAGIAGVATPLQSGDLTTILGGSRAARALTAFALVLVLGGVLVWRHEPFVDRAIDETLERPLVSVVYGVAAHVVIAFAAFLLAGKLANLGLAGGQGGNIGLLIGGLLLVAAAALGFTVVGATAGYLWGARYHWAGVVLGATTASVVAVAEPRVSAVAWVAVVSTGIGAPVRTWLHASEDLDG